MRYEENMTKVSGDLVDLDREVDTPLCFTKGAYLWVYLLDK